jgi:TRAP-type uncharacterized transport system fused permease subunit
MCSTLHSRHARCSCATYIYARRLTSVKQFTADSRPSRITIHGTLVAETKSHITQEEQERKEHPMNIKQLAAEVILIAFSVFSLYVIYQYGYIGLFEQALANAATIQVFLDLTIALSLVMVWMWQDAQKQGISPLPYILLTLTLGSIGPLVYLVRRLGKEVSPFTHPQTARL